MQAVNTIFQIAILIMSVVIHEVSHGYAASLQGDQTARYAGRLTLNPLKHLDLFGSVIVPLVTSLFGTTFGWAKPVPVNPYNLRNRQWGELLVSSAGIISNLVIAIIFGLIIRFGIENGLSPSFIRISSMIVIINLVLAIFNLMPVPPLDGSKILFSILPLRLQYIREFFERNSLFLILIFIFFIWDLLTPVIGLLFGLLTGLGV